MCRFLLVKYKKKLKPEKLIKDFALMCEKSRAPDGDWQGDGWGIAWQEKKSWKLHKSLSPVWEDQDKFISIPQTNLASCERMFEPIPIEQPISMAVLPPANSSLIFS